MTNPREHPQRYALVNEFHARPFARLTPPEQASHFALLTGPQQMAADRAHLLALCRRYGVTEPAEGANHFAVDLGPLRLKWERHTEFTTYTFFRQGDFDEPFAKPPAAAVPREWLDALPGELVVGGHVALVPQDSPELRSEELSRHFVVESLCGSLVAGGSARVWTDFQIHGDGFSRFLVCDMGLNDRQAGRLVQRLLEIETYRTMAMLALPVAREVGPRVTEVDQGLAALTKRMTQSPSLEDEQRMLDQLTRLSAEVEAIAAATAFRFGAAQAYYAVIEERLLELREERVQGFQTIREFMDRRLAPAMRTCASVAARQEQLAERVSRAADLLRTRVDIALRGQNRNLLASMNRRAQLQLHLQQTVEGLSVAAIAYYLVSLIGYAVKAIQSTGVTVDADLVRGLAIPAVALLVWIGLRRLRRTVLAEQRKQGENG